MKKKIVLIVLLCIILISGFIKAVEIYGVYRLDLVNIYIAKHNIQARKQVLEKDLEIVKYPRAFLSEEIILDKNDIIGKYNVINNLIPKGSFFYQKELEKIENCADYPLSLLKDHQNIFNINIGKIGNGINNLKVHQYVDIHLTIKNKDLVESDKLIENVRIIALYDAKDKLINSTDGQVHTVSLALDNAYINLLNKAMVLGEILIYPKFNYHDVEKESILNKNSKVLKYFNQ